MEQLLKKRSVLLTGCALDKQEECPISGEYTLPDYCSDVAVVLKCFAYPHIVNRQYSGDQLLLDGTAVIRVLYSDDSRHCLHSLEFTQPFTCMLRGQDNVDHAAVNLDLSTKYMNCRALNPRRLEVRGAIVVAARADCVAEWDVADVASDDLLYTNMQERMVTVPCAATEKVLSINESLEFPTSLPPAAMLLGGECRAVVRECKLLSGKAIIKGQVYLHQLYCDDTDEEGVRCLDFAVPFSQILDVDGALEDMPYYATVQVLSDTERCGAGPDGENTMLEISVKLLIQLQVHRCEEIPLVVDAYHGCYPVVVQTEEKPLTCLLGTRWEETVLPMRCAVQSGRWREILDVCVRTQECGVTCDEGRAEAKGRMVVSVVAYDGDGEVVYDEFVEDYTLSYTCRGNHVDIQSTPIEYKYRVVEDALELQVTLAVSVSDLMYETVRVLSDLRLQKDAPYPKKKVAALLYYADAGESIWEIGRNCHTSPDYIREENDLVDDYIKEAGVLLVPIHK